MSTMSKSLTMRSRDYQTFASQCILVTWPRIIKDVVKDAKII